MLETITNKSNKIDKKKQVRHTYIYKLKNSYVWRVCMFFLKQYQLAMYKV